MSVAPYQILSGPAYPYVAPVGTAFPTVGVTPSGAWVSLGLTEGGVSVHHTSTINQIASDQRTGPVKALRSAEGLNIDFTLQEVTLENYARALNSATVTSAAGPPATKTINFHRGFDVAQFALLIVGNSPYGPWNMQYQVPVVYQAAEPNPVFASANNANLATSWVALEDLTAASDSLRFGQLVAQSA